MRRISEPDDTLRGQCARAILAAVVMGLVAQTVHADDTQGVPHRLPRARVAVALIEPGPYAITLPEKVGLLLAGRDRTLAFEVAGRLTEIAPEGEPIGEGDIVASLDVGLEEARLRQVELRLREAEADLERQRGLRQSNAVSAKGLENAETALGIARADFDAAHEQLSRRTILAPFDGVVTETFAEASEVLSPSQQVATLMDLDPLRLELGIPGYQINEVAPGAIVLVTLPAIPEQVFRGTVSRVAIAAPRGKHLFEIEVSVPNEHGRFHPGMSARARIVTETLPHAVAIPADLPVQRGGERVVFFADEGRATSVSVEDAILHGDMLVLVREFPQRQLIVRGHRDLQDGLPVLVDNRVLAGPGSGP